MIGIINNDSCYNTNNSDYIWLYDGIMCVYIYREREIEHSWLVVDLPLWKMMEFVSWDDDIPNMMENQSHVPNHQPECRLVWKWVEQKMENVSVKRETDD